MGRFFYTNNRLVYTDEQLAEKTLDEKQLFSLFADNLRELREYCKLSLVQLSALVDIPNQTLSSYENKTHVPSMMQAVKIAAFFRLTVEEFIVCGLDEYPFDITELYERKKND